MRWSSGMKVFGLPVVDIALGPYPPRGEKRGRAMGIFAVGDSAIGVFAVGVLAFGAVPLGALSVGALPLGAVAVGLMAYGGVAVGFAAVGGVVAGWYACGALPVGGYVVSPWRIDPEAAEFFSDWLLWFLPPPPASLPIASNQGCSIIRLSHVVCGWIS